MIENGRRVFRFDTFGSEVFWGDTLQLHRALAGGKLGGGGGGVSPKTALAAGLKVDAAALPTSLKQQLKDGKVDLDDPATTLALLKLNSVVGVTGLFDSKGSLTSMGLQCALCHSTVDDSFAPGIGQRLDGWANRDLNVGLIISLAPNLAPFADLLGVDVATVKKVLTSWTGFGSVTYWNAYVAATEMHGAGTFFDARFDKQEQYPVAAKSRSGNMRSTPDVVTSKLPRFTFTSSLCRRRRHPWEASTRTPPREDGSCSTASRSARAATSRRSSPSRGTTGSSSSG